MVDALSNLETLPKQICEGCILGKMQMQSFKKDGAARKLRLAHLEAIDSLLLLLMNFLGMHGYMFCKQSHMFLPIFLRFALVVESECCGKLQTLRLDYGVGTFSKHGVCVGSWHFSRVYNTIQVSTK